MLLYEENEIVFSIRDPFKNYLANYKHLNSYLSHEQKNTIPPIRTRLEVDKQFSYLEQLGHVTNCINDVLTLSENDDNQILNKVDVALICAEVCDFYMKSYPQIVFHFNEEENSEIYAKERWIHRAVSNLVDMRLNMEKVKMLLLL